MSVAGVLAGRRVVVLEDDYFIAADLGRMVKSAGGDVIGPYGRVDEVREALSLAKMPVSAAVLDVNIKGQMTYALAEELMAAAIPFIFVTGYDARTIPAQFQAAPCLQKPVATELLVDTLVRNMPD